MRGALMLIAALAFIAATASCGGRIPSQIPPQSVAATPAPAGLGGGAVGSRSIVLATTTSTQDSGLLDVLVPLFESQTGYQVKTVAVGTGAALALGAQGEADVVLAHAPAAEEQWMAAGNGTERLLVMHNDFVIVGPPADPAAIAGDHSAVVALRAIAEKGARWVSRDDNSGTDLLEKQLWKEAGVDPTQSRQYIATGQGMGPTLTLADQENAYTLSDRATYLAQGASLQAKILVEGDPELLNIYHVMPVNPQKFPGVDINGAGGQAFADFLVSPAIQQVIGDFGTQQYGQPLFFADAGKPEPRPSE